MVPHFSGLIRVISAIICCTLPYLISSHFPNLFSSTSTFGLYVHSGWNIFFLLPSLLGKFFSSFWNYFKHCISLAELKVTHPSLLQNTLYIILLSPTMVSYFVHMSLGHCRFLMYIFLKIKIVYINEMPCNVSVHINIV